MASQIRVKTEAIVSLPCESTKGESPMFIRYLLATPFAPHAVAAPRQASTPVVVSEIDLSHMIGPII